MRAGTAAAPPPGPLRVAHVLNALRPSGAETMLVSAAPLWSAMGIAGEVIATGAEPGPFAAELSRAGFGVHHVPVGKSPADLWRFRRFLRDAGIDLVHQHAEGRGYWLSLAARSAGLPVLRTVHNNFPFSGNLRLRRTWQRRHARALGVRFVAIAPGVVENERQRFGNECELIWNWLDLSRFTPVSVPERQEARARRGIAAQRIVLASVGNCSEVKNHGAVISAMAKLSPRWDLHYLHAGVEDAAGSERRLAQELGLADRVSFAGWTRDVRDLLAAADAFVMPSRFEGLGNAALEALAMGLPALLADVPGLRDLRTLFPSIRYFAPDADALAASIDAWLSSGRGPAATPIAEQVDTCRRQFGAERGAAQYARLYRTLYAPPASSKLPVSA